MMTRHEFDQLVEAAGSDGASASVSLVAPDRPEDDYDQLMEAWLAERGRVVEVELLLSRLREVLARWLALGRPPSTADQRKLRRLIAEIDDQLCRNLDDGS